jgi:uncharacterized membrane protein
LYRHVRFAGGKIRQLVLKGMKKLPERSRLRARGASAFASRSGAGTMNFQTSIDVAAPPETVWSVMADVERWHEWTPSVRSIRLLDDGSLRVGSRALIRQPKFPPAMWTVTALDPGRSFTWKSGAPGMRVYAHHSVAPAADGARASLALHYEGAIGRLLGRLTRPITDRYLELEATGLKRRSEERHPAISQIFEQPPGD